jgi:hypothetical protein
MLKKTERREENWWSWPGLNRRPRECHSRALPTALQPHTANDASMRLGLGQENGRRILGHDAIPVLILQLTPHRFFLLATLTNIPPGPTILLRCSG